MNLSTNAKIALGVLAGGLAVVLINKYSSKKIELKSNFIDGDAPQGTGTAEPYDFDSDYDLTDADIESGFVGDDLFSDASGDKGKKRKLKHWQRRVKILTKKINLANKGLIKAQGRVDKWKAKLTEAQNKVAEFSK